MVLKPKLSNDEVSILIPKSIIEKEENEIESALIGWFIKVWPPLDIIQSCMKGRWSTKGWVSLVSLPREFLLFKFHFDDIYKKW